MNFTERALLERLEAMPIEEARVAIHTLAFGSQIGSPNHDFCLSWLAGKDATSRNAREEETLSNSRKALRISQRANKIAISAIIIAAAIPIIVAVIQHISQTKL